MKRRGISVKSLLIGFFTIVFFVCSVLSLGLMSKKTKTVSAASGTVELYQVAPNTGWLMECYVIKTANNKLIVIDGGADGSDTTHGSALTAAAYLPTALRAIAGVGENGYFEVEAWFVSHGHKDHFNELGKMLSTYTASSNYKINNIYFDFPDFGGSYAANSDWDSVGPQFEAGLNNYAAVNGIATSGSYYDDLNGAVVNAAAIADGLFIDVDGVRFDILQTWADGEDFNSNSMVIRMHAGDKTVLFLNDLAEAGGNRLTATYTTAELESDYVQMGHHGQTAVTQAHYTHMGATPASDTIYLWCAPLWTFSNSTSHTVYQNYEWVNGSSYMSGTTFNQSAVNTTRNKVACLYSAYPASLTSYTDWANCIGGMKVATFNYQEVNLELLGASVRTADPDGIRFVAQVKTDAMTSFGANAKYGVILVPDDMDTTRTLTVSYDGANYTTNNPSAMVIEGGDLWSEDLRAANGIASGYSAFSCALLADQGDGSSIVNFPTEFYNRPLTAVAFVIPTSGNTIYTSKVTRSIAYVAAVESLKTTYEENAVVEKLVAGTEINLSVYGGKLIKTTSPITPVLTIGGMDAMTSSAVNVSYKSSDDSVAKIVNDKVVAVGDGIADITATISVGGSKELTKTTSIETYINYVTFDSTTVKVQAGQNADVSFAFNARGKAYTLKDSTGAEVATTAYQYDASSTTLTMKASYLSTLEAGLYTYTLAVDDVENSTFTFTVAAYGNRNGKHLAFPGSIYGANNFDCVPLAAITQYLATSSTGGKPLYIDGADAAVLNTASGALSGRSLKFTTKSTKVTTQWNKLVCLNLGFEKGVTYNISLKAKISATGTSNQNFAVRFGDSTASESCAAFHLVNGAATSWSNVGSGSTVSKDSTTGIWTINASLVAPSAGAVLNLTTVGDSGNGGNWTVIIDDLCITVNEGVKSLVSMNFDALTAGAYTASETLYVGGSTAEVVTTDAISGKSLKAISSTAGESAQWNVMLKSKFGATVGNRYLVQFKYKYTLPTTISSGTIAVRLIGSAEVNGLFMNVSGGAPAVGTKSDTSSTMSYDSSTGIATVNAYMTATSADQELHITTVGGGAWTLIVDDLSISDVTTKAKHIYLDANDYTVGTKAADVFQAEGTGPNLHIASGAADDGVVDCGDKGKAFRVGANGVAIWFDNFAANVTWRFSIRFSVSGDVAISSLLLKWVNDGGVDANWIKDNAVSGAQTTDTVLHRDADGVWTWTCYLTSGATNAGQFVFYDVGNQLFDIYCIDISRA